MNIILYENKRVEDLYPFSVMHCSWEIRAGALSLFEKFQLFFPNSELFFKGRTKWVNSFLKRFDFVNNSLPDSDFLLLSGNFVLNTKSVKTINRLITENECFILMTSEGKAFAFYTSDKKDQISKYIEGNELIDLNDDVFDNYDRYIVDDVVEIEYIWDAVFINGKEINSDSEFFNQHHSLFLADYHGLQATNPNDIRIGNNVKISPSVVIDASEGKVLIDDDVKIMPQATILGPCFIGKGTTVKIGAKIYGETSIGPMCKVGGEIENTIIHAFSNKQHEGFLGHSYIGEWVNLGADTNNSDLKNTYGEINMILPHKEVKSGRIFLGLMCGDHTKSGINTMFTTGTVAGTCAILVKEWFLPNFIKSFSWGGKSNSPAFRFHKAIETAKIVMQRRGKVLTEEEIELLRLEYERICPSA
ncbi:MAG: putative sugar nucleotidyl transferase [Candidatus Kapaibacterium sp.]|jgi:UDP-N-acetylglucosamine diphosphorylase/glucosamine-1-phosphate N-acetyltransferase|nr:putative sugar nucleotidyl transferase [Candidatus Kapabacteria bacterium]